MVRDRARLERALERRDGEKKAELRFEPFDLNPIRARGAQVGCAFGARDRTERGYAVPAVVIDERHLVSGGQPVEVFERALRPFAAA
jgi:predicted DsbA family dithiol-disulfide isomerase